jgi:hypothetical protein
MLRVNGGWAVNSPDADLLLEDIFRTTESILTKRGCFEASSNLQEGRPGINTWRFWS